MNMRTTQGTLQAGLALVALTFFCAPVALVGGSEGCKPSEAPGLLEAGAPPVGAICTWLEGLTSNQTVISICADAEEVLQIATQIAPLLSPQADGGTCTPLPGTTVCATREQLGPAIQQVLRRRQARLIIDAGATTP